MIKAIIFDYDGVIVDSFNAIFLAWKKISEEAGAKIKIETLEQLKKVWTNNVIKTLETIGLSKEHFGRQEELVIENLEKESPLFFEGVKDILKELSKKYKLVIVSGSPGKVIEPKLKEEGILELFEFVIPIINPEKNKPDPYHINLALERLNANPNEVIYVGDSISDVKAAKNAHIDKIVCVSYGFGSRESLETEKPSIIVNSPKEILNAIKEVA